MNSRIQELMVELKKTVSTHRGAEVLAGYDEIEKFAELIVRECINIVKPTQHHEAFAQGYLGDIDGLELLDGKVKQIKQHFGVES